MHKKLRPHGSFEPAPQCRLFIVTIFTLTLARRYRRLSKTRLLLVIGLPNRPSCQQEEKNKAKQNSYV